MTNLKKLRVSLTKHGAHKVASLLKKFPAHEVLKNLSGQVPGINIETAQARKTLGADGVGTVPSFWADAKLAGDQVIDGLVFIALVFSHVKLIGAMTAASSKGNLTGRIERGTVVDGKEFTNFAHIIDELGFSTKHTVDYVDFNLKKLLADGQLGALAARLLRHRLISAGWDQSNTLEDECVANSFHQVLGATEVEFRAWLAASPSKPAALPLPPLADAEFFFEAKDGVPSAGFKFKAGHKKKKTGVVKVAKTPAEASAELMHNEIQNDLFAILVSQYGVQCVGTEVATGDGTSIDIVVQTPTFCRFYEIKTAESVKACIRQAIPQLLEYAYWHGKKDRADELVIVSPLPITKEAQVYLEFLKSEFEIPITYTQHLAK
jgi:hypothetical protein